MNTEKARHDIQARIDVARDLIDRAEVALILEWREDHADAKLSFIALSCDVAGRQLEYARTRARELSLAIFNAGSKDARIK